ncbi:MULTISPECIES: hypothetical protein [unclassified Streptomyces]|uniref:hypothetical protein n=1 Tax=unclassified Streptomyces TaxID=2593676 RepID=UPI000DB917E0|nr:hypothetical protein [Streptomyces sp. PsTaAH-137]MYT70865.1 hypothetical protein [Streptomyces sp. SID8367]RAJ90571.1 Mce-associated membrane protein [Streptomyces sp. PsTaAH-137]
MRRVLTGAGLAVALVVCGTGAWSYAQARGDSDLAYGRARDAVLSDGRTAVARLTTLDASTAARAKAGVREWKSVTTGPLRASLSSVSPAAGASSRGVVTDAAVTALDDRAGTSKLIATVRVTTGSAAPERKRLEAVLSRSADGTWKIKSLGAVPVTGESK